MEVWTQRLPRRGEAQHSYQAVCRALVAEAVELHTFLNIVDHSREVNGDFPPKLKKDAHAIILDSGLVK
ncbi:hypothetical protein ACOMHN_054041 [Nucella lapillus]